MFCFQNIMVLVQIKKIFTKMVLKEQLGLTNSIENNSEHYLWLKYIAPLMFYIEYVYDKWKIISAQNHYGP